MHKFKKVLFRICTHKKVYFSSIIKGIKSTGLSHSLEDEQKKIFFCLKDNHIYNKGRTIHRKGRKQINCSMNSLWETKKGCMHAIVS